MVGSKSGSEIPGPGNYEAGTGFGKAVRGGKIAERTQEMKKLDVPGPGSYEKKDILTKAASASQMIGSSKRPDII